MGYLSAKPNVQLGFKFRCNVYVFYVLIADANEPFGVDRKGSLCEPES